MQRKRYIYISVALLLGCSGCSTDIAQSMLIAKNQAYAKSGNIVSIAGKYFKIVFESLVNLGAEFDQNGCWDPESNHAPYCFLPSPYKEMDFAFGPFSIAAAPSQDGEAGILYNSLHQQENTLSGVVHFHDGTVGALPNGYWEDYFVDSSSSLINNEFADWGQSRVVQTIEGPRTYIKTKAAGTAAVRTISLGGVTPADESHSDLENLISATWTKNELLFFRKVVSGIQGIYRYDLSSLDEPVKITDGNLHSAHAYFNDLVFIKDNELYFYDSISEAHSIMPLVASGQPEIPKLIYRGSLNHERSLLVVSNSNKLFLLNEEKQTSPKYIANLGSIYPSATTKIEICGYFSSKSYDFIIVNKWNSDGYTDFSCLQHQFEMEVNPFVGWDVAYEGDEESEGQYVPKSDPDGVGKDSLLRSDLFAFPKNSDPETPSEYRILDGSNHEEVRTIWTNTAPIAIKDKLFFVGMTEPDSGFGIEVMVSDGSTEGTKLIHDLYTEQHYKLHRGPSFFREYSGLLLFSSDFSETVDTSLNSDGYVHRNALFFSDGDKITQVVDTFDIGNEHDYITDIPRFGVQVGQHFYLVNQTRLPIFGARSYEEIIKLSLIPVDEPPDQFNHTESAEAGTNPYGETNSSASPDDNAGSAGGSGLPH